MTEKRTAEERIGDFLTFGSRLGLDRIRELLSRLDHPQKDLRIIHVAGTNGKGSVCRYLYEVLEANGYRTGLYTSPYIETFRERMEYHGQLISEEDLERHGDRVIAAAQAMVEDGFESPTEFEVVTAIGFCYFAEKEADFVILEVGLGGRGDSTNVIEAPLLSIITSISYDHMDRLGDTLEKIAGEKAGIIKEGIPVVSGVTEREAAKVIARTAYDRRCVLYDATGYKRTVAYSDDRGSLFSAWIGETHYPEIALSMCGTHQVDNALCALTGIEILRKSGIINVTLEKLRDGFFRAKQKGRFEIIGTEPAYVLDGAHNRDGMRVFVETAKACFPDKRALVVVGMLKDKEVDVMLDELAELPCDIIATEPPNPRRLKADALASKLRDRGQAHAVEADPVTAMTLAMERGGDYDVVYVVGSLYLIGAVRRCVTV